MENTPNPQPNIMDIELYVGGKGPSDGSHNVVKLSSNENPLGPSPLAKSAFRDQAELMNYYPSSDHADLRNTIGAIHDLNPDQIIIGNGSDEIISFLCQAYAGVGDEVLFTEHGFGMYKISAQTASATPVEVPETDRTVNVDALIAGITDNTRIIFLANPSNPTGTFVLMDELERLAQNTPSNVVLVLDAAYAEYVDGYDGGASLVDRFNNVVMTRTFSKVYGLGGLRVGWAYAPVDIIEVLARMRGPFNVNIGALAAAKAAMQDREYLAFCLAENAKAGQYLVSEFNAMGLPCDATHANFVLPRFKDEKTADAAEAALSANGLIVRKVKGYKLPNCLRITIGKTADCKRVISVLKEFMGA